MTEPVAPSEGRGVVHLFCKPTASFDEAAATAAIEKAQADDVQVVTVSMLGHKADVAIMAMHPDWWELRKLQSAITASGPVSYTHLPSPRDLSTSRMPSSA